MTCHNSPRVARRRIIALLFSIVSALTASACAEMILEDDPDIIVESDLPTRAATAPAMATAEEPAETGDAPTSGRAPAYPAPDRSESSPPPQTAAPPSREGLPTAVVGSGAFGVQVKRMASDPDERDHFGESVALSGDRAIVGAYHDGERGAAAGAAYILERQGSGLDDWVEVAKLTASDARDEDWFGLAVDIDGDLAAVGAGHADPRGTNSGAVYLYRRDEGGAWGEVASIVPEDGEPHDWFGNALSLDGTRLAVGAPMPTKGMAPPYDLNMGSEVGKVYVFELQADGSWSQEAVLEPAQGLAGDRFGFAVDLQEDRLVVGAPSLEPENVMGGPLEMFGHVPEEVLALHSGATYVFERRADTNWEAVARLVPEGAEELAGIEFGSSVALDGTTVVVGAPLDDRRGEAVGAAFVFDLEAAGSWRQTATVLPEPPLSPGFFGIELSLDGPQLAVGAHFQEMGSASGAVFLYAGAESGDWVETARLEAADAHPGQIFGGTVALDDRTLLVGALNDEQAAPYAGAVYFFGPEEP